MREIDELRKRHDAASSPASPPPAVDGGGMDAREGGNAAWKSALEKVKPLSQAHNRPRPPDVTIPPPGGIESNPSPLQIRLTSSD